MTIQPAEFDEAIRKIATEIQARINRNEECVVLVLTADETRLLMSVLSNTKDFWPTKETRALYDKIAHLMRNVPE